MPEQIKRQFERESGQGAGKVRDVDRRGSAEVMHIGTVFPIPGMTPLPPDPWTCTSKRDGDPLATRQPTGNSASARFKGLLCT